MFNSCAELFHFRNLDQPNETSCVRADRCSAKAALVALSKQLAPFGRAFPERSMTIVAGAFLTVLCVQTLDDDAE